MLLPGRADHGRHGADYSRPVPVELPELRIVDVDGQSSSTAPAASSPWRCPTETAGGYANCPRCEGRLLGAQGWRRRRRPAVETVADVTSGVTRRRAAACAAGTSIRGMPTMAVPPCRAMARPAAVIYPAGSAVARVVAACRRRRGWPRLIIAPRPPHSTIKPAARRQTARVAFARKAQPKRRRGEGQIRAAVGVAGRSRPERGAFPWRWFWTTGRPADLGSGRKRPPSGRDRKILSSASGTPGGKAIEPYQILLREAHRPTARTTTRPSGSCTARCSIMLRAERREKRGLDGQPRGRIGSWKAHNTFAQRG